jgi:predicted MPP superfamily phosphohydrolase
VFKTLGLPVYTVIGNHDYLGDPAKEPPPPPMEPAFRAPRDDRPEPKPAPPPERGSRASYEKFFPDRLNYWFKHRGWQFVGLDTSDGLRYEQTSIQDATFAWVDRSLGRFEKRLPTVILTHFPLGEGVKYRPLNADALLERFREHNLQAVFSGHFHGFTERHAGAVTLTTNRCCALQRSNHDGTKQKGYFVCTARDGRIEREFVEFKTT